MSIDKRKRKRSGGVTLIEIMVTMGILAIIIVPVMRSFATSVRVNARARRAMIATDVAETIMEGFSGKAYEDVYEGITRLDGPVNYSTASDDVKYAFSSVNDNFYNAGHAEQIDFPPESVTGTLTNVGFANEASMTPLNQQIAQKAVEKLSTKIMNAPSTAGSFLMPNEDRTIESTPYIYTDGNPSVDKLIFYAYNDVSDSSIRNSKDEEIPMSCALVYTRVQKYNYFFDVVVTFVPRAQNKGKDEHDNPIQDKFFVYEVTVSVYDYNYDDVDISGGTVDWPSRFEGGVFEGDPIVQMTSGMMSLGYLEKD